MIPGRVSLITAVYNKEKYVEQSIRSSLAIDYPDLELVIINDGSTDNSRNIIQKYANDSRVRIIDQPNAGSARALHTAITASTGEFFIRCDADDWKDPRFVRATIHRMSEPDVAAVCGHTILEGDVHRVSRTESFGDPRYTATITELKRQNWIPAALTRRTAYDQTPGFNPNAGIYADWNLWIDITKRGWKIALVEEVLHHYRITYLSTPGSETAQGVGKHEENFKIIRSLHPDLWPTQPETVCRFCGGDKNKDIKHRCPFCPFCGVEIEKDPNHECEACRCGECGNMCETPHDAQICQRKCGAKHRRMGLIR
jgi:glycosyltransferase involved in cell wall biosynthesis